MHIRIYYNCESDTTGGKMETSALFPSWGTNSASGENASQAPCNQTLATKLGLQGHNADTGEYTVERSSTEVARPLCS